jgi:hypothetical protein
MRWTPRIANANFDEFEIIGPMMFPNTFWKGPIEVHARIAAITPINPRRDSNFFSR